MDPVSAHLGAPDQSIVRPVHRPAAERPAPSVPARSRARILRPGTLSPELRTLNEDANRALDMLLAAHDAAHAVPEKAITDLLEAGFDTARRLAEHPHVPMRRRESVVLQTPPLPPRALQTLRTLSARLDRLRGRIQAGWDRLDRDELAAAGHGVGPTAAQREPLRQLAQEADAIGSALAALHAGVHPAPASLADTARRLQALKSHPTMRALHGPGLLHRSALGRDDIPENVQDTLNGFIGHACGRQGARARSPAHALIQPTEQTLAESTAFTEKFSHYHAMLLDLVPPRVRADEAFWGDLQRQALASLMRLRGGKLSLTELQTLMAGGRLNEAALALVKPYRALMLGALTEGIVQAARQHGTRIDLQAFQQDLLRRAGQLDTDFGEHSARATAAASARAAQAAGGVGASGGGQALIDPHQQITRSRQQLEKTGHAPGSEAVFNLLCRFSEGILYVESRRTAGPVGASASAGASPLTPPAAPPSA